MRCFLLGRPIELSDSAGHPLSTEIGAHADLPPRDILHHFRFLLEVGVLSDHVLPIGLGLKHRCQRVSDLAFLHLLLISLNVVLPDLVVPVGNDDGGSGPQLPPLRPAVDARLGQVAGQIELPISARGGHVLGGHEIRRRSDAHGESKARLNTKLPSEAQRNNASNAFNPRGGGKRTMSEGEISERDGGKSTRYAEIYINSKAEYRRVDEISVMIIFCTAWNLREPRPWSIADDDHRPHLPDLLSPKSVVRVDFEGTISTDISRELTATMPSDEPPSHVHIDGGGVRPIPAAAGDIYLSTLTNNTDRRQVLAGWPGSSCGVTVFRTKRKVNCKRTWNEQRTK